MSDTFVYIIFIEAAPDKIWKALTNGEFTRQYWAGRRIESDWKQGSIVRLFLEDTQDFEVSGEVLEYDPPHRLAYTWNSIQSDIPPSRVTIELQTMGKSVKLTLTHEPLPLGGTSRQGWSAILSSLKSYLETGKPISATELWRRRAA